MPTLGDKIEQDMARKDHSGVLTTDKPGIIEKTLDRCLRTARYCKENGINEYVNALFIGGGGSGKTSRIKAWAKANGINLVEIHTSDLGQGDMGGAIAPDRESGTKVTRLSPTEMDELDQPNSVLFLDEYNRAIDLIRGSLLTLVENHTVLDTSVKGRRRELKGMLFTVAAINPADSNYSTQTLDGAEESRFLTKEVPTDPIVTLKYLSTIFPSDSQAYKVAKILLTNRNFSFTLDSEAEKVMEEGNRKILSARTLTRLLEYVENNYKEDGEDFNEMFLEEWDSFCDSFKKPTVTAILSEYHDVDDKANDALKGGTQSKVFGKTKSFTDQILDLD